ncbi:MAG: hypothetical protein H0V29_04685 [Thermoleophilaceae bacterium]|nr:hypothetical protein [Thermoleophilaceae bacterium]
MTERQNPPGWVWALSLVPAAIFFAGVVLGSSRFGDSGAWDGANELLVLPGGVLLFLQGLWLLLLRRETWWPAGVAALALGAIGVAVSL